MKQIIAASTFAMIVTTSSAHSGALSDPILEQDLIVAEAENSSAKQDVLILTVTLMTLAALAGGAF